jgi:hypothetical protein
MGEEMMPDFITLNVWLPGRAQKAEALFATDDISVVQPNFSSLDGSGSLVVPKSSANPFDVAESVQEIQKLMRKP